MSFYKETWMEMDKFTQMIQILPSSNTRINTIQIDTITLRKYLMSLPKQVIDSIRSNVTSTMESETKILREELSKTSEILLEVPVKLNTYVE